VKYLDLTFDMQTVSELNIRGSKKEAMRRKKQQKVTVLAHLLASRVSGKDVGRKRPLRITITRLASARMDSHDNLPSAFKVTVDQVCRWLAVDDGDPGLSFAYRQETSRPAKTPQGVRIEIEGDDRQATERDEDYVDPAGGGAWAI